MITCLWLMGAEGWCDWFEDQNVANLNVFVSKGFGEIVIDGGLSP